MRLNRTLRGDQRPLPNLEKEGNLVRVVLKVGGSVLHEGNVDWVDELARLIKEGHRCVVVHGGGTFISQALSDLGEPVQFIQGQRVTSPRSLQEVIKILRGQVNVEIVSLLQSRGIPSVGISGADAQMMRATPMSSELGRVGRITAVNSDLIGTLWHAGYLPVIAPIAQGSDGGLLNCNGDFAAAFIAGALSADTLIFYTDSGGVRRDPEDPSTITPVLSAKDVQEWISSGRATAGMVPKLQASLAALEQGVRHVQIGSFFHKDSATTLSI